MLLGAACSDGPRFALARRSTRLLVQTLANGTEGPRQGLADRAVAALWRMVRENPDHKVNIARAGGAEPLVYLLRDSVVGGPVQEYALWSLSLAIEPSNHQVVLETGMHIYIYIYIYMHAPIHIHIHAGGA